jgi:hypothetical protein
MLVFGFSLLSSAQLFTNGYTTISSPNIGIGTNAPQKALHLYKSFVAPSGSPVGYMRLSNERLISFSPYVTTVDDWDIDIMGTASELKYRFTSPTLGLTNYDVFGIHSNKVKVYAPEFEVSSYFKITNTGYCGIGTLTPTYPLHVVGQTTTDQLLVNNNANIQGSLRIGTQQATGAWSGYRLSVDGDIIAKRFVVQITNWADDVFDKNYKMPTLYELKNYVELHKHLPNIPSETEVKTNGISVGDMDANLLRKVEELTLYLIEVQTQIDKLKTENEQLQLLINSNK